MRGRDVVIAGLAILLGGASAARAQVVQVPLSPTSIPQFVEPLPLLDVARGPIATVVGATSPTVRMCAFEANVLPAGTFAPGVRTPTRVWGYSADPRGCPTTVQETYIGPVILSSRGTPTAVTYLNELGDTSSAGTPLFYKGAVDRTLHWADPLRAELVDKCVESVKPGSPAPIPCNQAYAGPIPAVVHLHGGEVPPELDGGPEGWFTSGVRVGTDPEAPLYYPKGDGYYTKSLATDPRNGAVYVYPNRQEAAPAWFHDHALGVTRLNVYAGLAGAYLISDPGQVLGAGLHPYGLSYGLGPDGKPTLDVPTIPLVIQDRMFDTTGQLYFPSAGINPEHPFWIPEFMGDTIVVNGKAWPYLNVEPRRYRFLVLNGSNARTYTLTLGTGQNAPTFWQIGTDGGYLDAPVALKALTIMPGERQEIVVDFGSFAPGTTLLLANSAKSPYPGGSPPQGATVGRVLQVRVGACSSGGRCGVADTSFNPALPGAWVRQTKIQRLVEPATGRLAAGVVPAVTRQLTLNEIVDPRTKVGGIQYPGGPMQILLNNSMYSADTATTSQEMPLEGTTEVWEIVNLTADAHPVHLHLVQFQLMNRQPFDVRKYGNLYNASFLGGFYVPGQGPPLGYDVPNASGAVGGNPDVLPFLQGALVPPPPQEAGWKDTIVAPPGTVTRLAVRWAPTDLPVTSPRETLAFPFSPNSSTSKGYVWHCHIIDHEDNEMMRPSFVQPNTANGVVRPVVRGASF